MKEFYCDYFGCNNRYSDRDVAFFEKFGGDLPCGHKIRNLKEVGVSNGEVQR